MKIICEKEHLMQNIQLVTKAVSSKSTIPILECILIQAGDIFTLTGNELDLAIKTAPIPAEIIEEGSVALEAKIFSDIVRKLPNEKITIDTKENNITLITCGKSEFKILGQPAAEFPDIPNVEKENAFLIQQEELKTMIRDTIFSVSQDESKPVYTGELLEIEDGVMFLVSVDGYRISLRKTQIDYPGSLEAIIPAKTLNELSKILEEEEIHIYTTEKHVLFETGQCTMVSSLLEGKFLKYQQSFVGDYTTKILVDRSDIFMALERASLLSRDDKKNPVKLHLHDDVMEINATSEMGTCHEEVLIDMDGEDLEISFNPRYLLDVFKVIGDEKVVMLFNNHVSPCVIEPVEGDLYRYLVLPLKIKQ